MPQSKSTIIIILASIIHILNDLFSQPAPSSFCATAVCWVLTLFEDLNILIAPKKTFRPSQSMLLGWSSKYMQVCHLWDLQSLIGTLQLAWWVISPGQAFLQHITNLSERTFTCGTFFSSTGMVSTSFSPLTLKPPQTSTSILMLLGGQVMEKFYDNRWFQCKWLPFHQLHSVTVVSISWQQLYPIYLAA